MLVSVSDAIQQMAFAYKLMLRTLEACCLFLLLLLHAWQLHASPPLHLLRSGCLVANVSIGRQTNLVHYPCTYYDAQFCVSLVPYAAFQVSGGGSYVPPEGHISGQIELRHVVFHYPSRPHLRVLSGLSFVVNPGGWGRGRAC